jgi:alkylation response protein AidB-like acyl-CoA dehydrogenase
MQFVLHELLDVVDEFKDIPEHAEVDADTINAVLEEGGKFAAGRVPAEHQRRRRRLRAGQGHPRGDHAQGLQGSLRPVRRRRLAGAVLRPRVRRPGPAAPVNQCFYEMLNSANQAWTMYPGLSHGAYEALHAHGTDEQKKTYLPKLTSGEWTGTMCLTEPHCGTDLGLLRTKAEPQADGSYKITGQKIFISAGEHDMAENIVHLVLARLPDAPAGSKGISLFVVPKFKVNADGSLGERNPIYCGGLEHKMGIHGNATCQMCWTAPWARWSASPTRACRPCS